jgi:hypothetical protein
MPGRVRARKPAAGRTGRGSGDEVPGYPGLLAVTPAGASFPMLEP